MIEEDFISFETAKLLKEKGFHEPANSCYTYIGSVAYTSSYDWNLTTGKYADYSRVQLWVAMKWLRDEKHYYIQVMLDGWACGGHSGYYVVIQKTDSDFEVMLQDAVDEVFYQTYEEACMAGIKYCLENLI